MKTIKELVYPHNKHLLTEGVIAKLVAKIITLAMSGQIKLIANKIINDPEVLKHTKEIERITKELEQYISANPDKLAPEILASLSRVNKLNQ